MSSKTTIIWLLLAVALGAAALLLLRTGKTSAPGTGPSQEIGSQLIHIDPSTASRISVINADGGRETLERVADGWAMVVHAAGGTSPGGTAAGPSPAWSVPTTRIQALIRQLNDARVRAIPDAGAQLGAQAVTVEIVEQAVAADAAIPAPGTTTITFDDASVAGNALVRIDRPTSSSGERQTFLALTDDSPHRLFRAHAPREWRDRTALLGVGLEASRVTLENSRGARLALGRVDGAWSVREPISAPADPAAIQRLLSMLASVQIVDFLDLGPPGGEASTRLDSPAASLSIETDRPSAPTPVLRTLDIGGAADAAGTRLYARIDRERTVIIDARTVADLKLDAGAFVWPYPTRLNPADIGTIALERTGAAASDSPGGGGAAGTAYRRSLDRWQQIRDGQEMLLPEAETRPILALLGFLCGPAGPAPASSPVAQSATSPLSITAAAPEGLTPLGRITLLSLTGAPLDVLELGATRAGAAGAVVVRTGSVYRAYALDRVPSLISAFAEPAASKPQPASADVPEPSK